MPDATIGGDLVPERSRSMAWQTVQGETVLLSIDGKELMGLNEVGACVWSLADGAHTVDQIIEGGMAKFRVPAERVAADVRTFLEELIALGALVWRNG